MNTLQIEDKKLKRQLTELLEQRFNGDTDKMLQELLRVYISHLKRLNYSGILAWGKDGVTYQRELRREWQ